MQRGSHQNKNVWEKNASIRSLPVALKTETPQKLFSMLLYSPFNSRKIKNPSHTLSNSLTRIPVTQWSPKSSTSKQKPNAILEIYLLPLRALPSLFPQRQMINLNDHSGYCEPHRTGMKPVVRNTQFNGSSPSKSYLSTQNNWRSFCFLRDKLTFKTPPLIKRLNAYVKHWFNHPIPSAGRKFATR